MIADCARCGHQINTETEDGQAQGITRAWVASGDSGEYRDFHKLCRELDIRERSQPVAAVESAKRGPGRPRKDSAPVLAGAVAVDEM